MIKGMLNSGAIPVLQRLVQFTGARHQVLAHNIANLSTPYFKPQDLDPVAFQRELAEAVDRRRRSANPDALPLRIDNTSQFRFDGDNAEFMTQASNENILFHDENNRDLERTMQRLAENTMTHRMGIEMLKNEFDLLRMAIRERF